MLSKSYFQMLKEQTDTECWVNNPTRKESETAIAKGIVNCTTNPTFTMKQIQREPDNLCAIIDRICNEESDDNKAASRIQNECVKQIMDIFMPAFDLKTRTSGLVSIQGNPILEDDPKVIISEIRENKKLSPNYLAKIPATKAGIKAMEFAIEQDVPFIATEIMSIAQAVTICDLYKKTTRETGNYPPMFVTHITGIFDEYVREYVKTAKVDIPEEYLKQAGLGVGRKLYKMFKERNYPGRMLGGGARGIHHFTGFIGADMSITINWKGMGDVLCEENPKIEELIDTPISDKVVKVLEDKIPAFKAAWNENGLDVEDFAGFGPVVLFRDSFIKGWRFLLAEIKKRRYPNWN